VHLINNDGLGYYFSAYNATFLNLQQISSNKGKDKD